MRSLRSWFTEERASDVSPDYTSQLLAQSLAAARGIDGIKSTAAYRGALTLIGHSTGVATLTGQHSDSLQPHLSTIARSMVSTGQSDWLINVGSAGEVVLLPVTAAAVVGGPDPRTWVYTLDPKIPWRGRPAIDSTGTGQLLCQLESQMSAEARVAPARLVTGGQVSTQAGDITDTIKAGGIVTLIQAIASREDPAGIRAGTIKNEVSASSVSLHLQVERAICGVMGVPSDLVLGSSSESGSRESFRRLASTTINNILTTVAREWQDKLGTALEWDLDRLRSSDDVSRARATGSRATAVQRLVQSGVELPQALILAGVD